MYFKYILKEKYDDWFMKRKKICFISETSRINNPIDDGSVRYRAYHPAEALLKAGNFCSVYSAKQFCDSPCFDYDVYIFHRPTVARPMICDLVRTLKKLGKVLIADYDDLIFGDDEIALSSSIIKNGHSTPEAVIKNFSNNLQGLRLFDLVTVSTMPLAEKVSVYNPGARVEVVPNIVSGALVSLHEKLRTPWRQRKSSSIGYFAGTKSHDKDFPVVEDALYKVLSENSDFELLVVGPVSLPKHISALPNVSVSPLVNYMHLPGLMSSVSTVIAPLEVSFFNSCKSRVKFLEAALAGCRLIASPIPDMQAVGDSHLTFAENSDEWYAALSKTLAEDEQISLAKGNFDFIKKQSSINGLMVLAGI